MARATTDAADGIAARDGDFDGGVCVCGIDGVDGLPQGDDDDSTRPRRACPAGASWIGMGLGDRVAAGIAWLTVVESWRGHAVSGLVVDAAV